MNKIIIKICGCYLVVFHLYLLLIIFTQRNLCCIRKPTMKLQQTSYWKLDLSQFSYGYWKCMFVDFLNWMHVSSQLCSLSSVDLVNIFWKRSSIFFEHVSLRCLFVDLHLAIHRSNIGVQLKGSIWVTPTYLRPTRKWSNIILHACGNIADSEVVVLSLRMCPL
jgi:hypothetical protein